jgi:hypothetical protein
LEETSAVLNECLQLGTQLWASWRVLPRALSWLAGVVSLGGEYGRSARLLGAADALCDASGKRDTPQWQTVFEADVAMVRSALGYEPFSEAMVEGRAMRLEHALACALGDRGNPLESNVRPH